jgi:hypothetical protein
MPLLGNEAINKIATNLTDSAAKRYFTAAWKSVNTPGVGFGHSLKMFGKGIKQYYFGSERYPVTFGQSALRFGATFAGLDVASDLLSRGVTGLTYDEYGRFNISGVPFI